MIDELTNEFYCNEIETSSNDDSEPKTDSQLPHPTKGLSDAFPFASNLIKLQYVYLFLRRETFARF